MSRTHDVHVVSDPSLRGFVWWTVVWAGDRISRHRLQRKAVMAGLRIARQARVDLVTHALNGRIRSKDSYGNERAIRDTEH